MSTSTPIMTAVQLYIDACRASDIDAYSKTRERTVKKLAQDLASWLAPTVTLTYEEVCARRAANSRRPVSDIAIDIKIKTAKRAGLDPIIREKLALADFRSVILNLAPTHSALKDLSEECRNQLVKFMVTEVLSGNFGDRAWLKEQKELAVGIYRRGQHEMARSLHSIIIMFTLHQFEGWDPKEGF